MHGDQDDGLLNQPNVQFKFRSVNEYLIDSLEKSQIYFASTDQLNDPHDCRVDIHRALGSAIEKADPKRRAFLEHAYKQRTFWDGMADTLSTFGVCSFSANGLDTAMWGNYADKHKGVCLTYAIPDEFISEKNRIVGRAAVGYGERPLEEFFLGYPWQDPLKSANFPEETMKKALIVKGKRWENEDENRIIRRFSGPLTIPPEFLTQVFFGLRTSDENKELIRRVIEPRYPAVQFAQVERGAAEFDLVAIDLR